MIDTASLLLFSAMVVYTTFRAVKLDKLLPWFSRNSEQEAQESKQTLRK